MSETNGNGNGSGPSSGRRKLDEAVSARQRADLVSGLRGLTRAGAASRRRPAGAGSGSGAAGKLGIFSTEGRVQPPQPVDQNDPDMEYCELCNAPLPHDHRHLLHLGERRMLCACETCWSVRSGEADYRPAGVRTAWLDGLEIPDEAWASFQVPIGLAFFMRTGEPSKVFAFYPSPAGATESEIDLDAWERLEAANPVLERLEPDSEALLVNRMVEPHVHVIAPIDDCYRLVGMIKTEWEGISGGSGVDEAIARFFAELKVQGALSGRINE